jgi:hypothetical protein
MLTFKLTMNKLTNNARFATTEKSPIFQSHKSCSNTLNTIGQEKNSCLKTSKFPIKNKFFKLDLWILILFWELNA